VIILYDLHGLYIFFLYVRFASLVCRRKLRHRSCRRGKGGKGVASGIDPLHPPFIMNGTLMVLWQAYSTMGKPFRCYFVLTRHVTPLNQHSGSRGSIAKRKYTRE
jgi:hypothetical protein